MRRMVILTIAVFLAWNGCNGQTGKKENDISVASNMPKTGIKVNKEYDEHGNLIKYDSTYSYYYSNIENDSVLRDSIFDNFKSHFDQSYLFSDDPFFNDLFFQDSLLHYDFFKNDFFSNRFRLNTEHMNKLFMELDSLKNSFFMDQFHLYDWPGK